MLIHFIGGPAHGCTQTDKNPRTIYRMAEAKRTLPLCAVREGEGLPPLGERPLAFCAVREGEGLPPLGERPFTEHEYRITKRTRRYCIAEYIAPKVKATAEVCLEVSTCDYEALDALSRWCYERRSDAGQPGDTKLVAVLKEWTGQARLQFETLVDGPADAAAAAEAGENVQTFLDRYLPEKVRLAATITQSGVSVE